jgi:hypothetical protein
MLDQDQIVFLPNSQHSTLAGLIEDGFLVAAAPTELFSTINTYILSMRYGLTNNITVGLIPRVLSQSLDVDLTGFDHLEIPTNTELGDTEFLLKYQLWGKRKQHISFYTLLNLPTGREVKVKGKEPLITRYGVQQEDGITTVQAYKFDFIRYVPFGSESFDLAPGIALTFGLDPLVFHSNIQYKFTDDILIGDEFRLNLATIYNMNSSVNAIMEMNFRWRGEARRRFHTVLFKFQPDSITINMEPVTAGPVAIESYYTDKGGSSLFISPGLQFTVAEGIRVEAGVQIPVIKPSTGWTEYIIYHLGVTFLSF